MEKFSSWLADQDDFGTWAKFNFRGKSGYGTGYGGCITLFLTIMTIGFIILQITGFAFTPNYNSQSTTFYLDDSQENITYFLQPGDFIPNFMVMTNVSNTITYNNSTYFDIFFETYDS